MLLAGGGLGPLQGVLSFFGGLLSGEGKTQGPGTKETGFSCTARTWHAGGEGPQGVTPGETGP